MPIKAKIKDVTIICIGACVTGSTKFDDVPFGGEMTGVEARLAPLSGAELITRLQKMEK